MVTVGKKYPSLSPAIIGLPETPQPWWESFVIKGVPSRVLRNTPPWIPWDGVSQALTFLKLIDQNVNLSVPK